jgi:hypothetical protein
MQVFRIVIFVGIFLVLIACGSADSSEFGTQPTDQVASVQSESTLDATGVAPTSTVDTVSPTITPLTTNTRTPSPTATATATATASPTPTPVPPTATDEPELVSVAESSVSSVNVRRGPGTDYEVIDTLRAGDVAVVTGRNDNESWWQIALVSSGRKETNSLEKGWVYAEIVAFSGDREDVVEAVAPPRPTPTQVAESDQAPGETDPATSISDKDETQDDPVSPDELTEQLRCGKDFCVTYQAMVPIWENGGCIGNHSIYVTVLEGPPPGRPLDGIVIGDTFGNIEVASGSKGPGHAEVTLWMNSMSLLVKRHIDGREFTSEESFSFTSHDELIPAEVLAANGYCDGNVETCRQAQQQNQVCRGHYSWRVTFHKFD